jgi:hypothetical protein
VRVKWKCASSKHTKSGGGKSGGRRCGNPVSCLAVAWSISSIVIRFFVLLTKLEIYERCCASYALYAPIQIPVAGARPLRRSLRAAWVPAALAVGGRGGGGGPPSEQPTWGYAASLTAALLSAQRVRRRGVAASLSVAFCAAQCGGWPRDTPPPTKTPAARSGLSRRAGALSALSLPAPP